MPATTKTQQALEPEVDVTDQQVAKKSKNAVVAPTKKTATRSSTSIAEQRLLQQRQQQQMQAQGQRHRQIEEYEATASAEAKVMLNLLLPIFYTSQKSTENSGKPQ